VGCRVYLCIIAWRRDVTKFENPLVKPKNVIFKPAVLVTSDGL
jgi:hypothetical protein